MSADTSLRKIACMESFGMLAIMRIQWKQFEFVNILHAWVVHPLTPADQLSESQLAELISHIKKVLKKSIKQGGSSLKDFTVADEQTGYFQQTLHIYGKHNQPCPKCGQTIEKVNITGRSSTFCPSCQPYDQKR